MQLRSSMLLVQATVKATCKGCAESTARSWLAIYGRGCEGRGEDQYCSEATCESQSNVQLTTKNMCELRRGRRLSNLSAAAKPKVMLKVWWSLYLGWSQRSCWSQRLLHSWEQLPRAVFKIKGNG